MFFLGLSLLLSGCGNKDEDKFEKNISNLKMEVLILDDKFKSLSSHVSNPESRGKYESLLASNLSIVDKEHKDNPEVKKLVSQFRNDSKEDGVLFAQYKQRYDDIITKENIKLVKNGYVKKEKYASTINSLNSDRQEVLNATRAMEFDVYDGQFIDYINILASLSKNVSPVEVNELNKDAPLGNQLVGNPMYGQWKTDSGGNRSWSFLEAYAVMSIIDSTMGGRSRYGNRYEYGYWQSNRNYSYGNDYYRNQYSSPRNTSQYNKYQSNLSSNPKYANKTYKNDTLSKQNTTLSSKGSKYSSNLASSRSSRSGNSTLNKNQSGVGNKSPTASKYSSNLNNRNPSTTSNRMSGSSSKSKVGGK
jgi:hypothetical protein